MEHEFIAVIDFGGHMNQLVARRVRELGVYCEILHHTTPIDVILAKKPIGVILTGGAGDPTLEDAPGLAGCPLDLKVPILGIGYGGRYITHMSGGKLGGLTTYPTLTSKEYKDSALFSGLDAAGDVWVEEVQAPVSLQEGFSITAVSPLAPLAWENPTLGLYITQFHPEVSTTHQGSQVIKNFLQNICGAHFDWTMDQYGQRAVQQIKKQVGDGKVLLALSGGVDSSVVAVLLEKAVGDQLYCIFVDHGLMRLNEGNEVEAAFKDSGMHFIRVDAQARFLNRLQGIVDPEEKRKIIGEEFIRVFEEEAKKIGQVDYFAQGTIYPDVIESETPDGSVIKSHHNVGGLPDHVDFKEIIEPVRMLFKDEVRQLGLALGVPDYLVWRQPFPGPGLGIRVLGEVTKERLDILRLADAIFREEIAKAGLDRSINQYFAVLTTMRSVGVAGDKRTYDYTLALRGVSTTDFMTAYWYKIPYELLDLISSRIVSEVEGINRIVYDITSKPPATIEWE